MDNQYSVIFKGEIADGENIDNVKKKLAAMFKTDGKNIDKFFSGKAHTVKKDISLETGKKIKTAFLKAGALCHLIKKESDKVAPKLENKNRTTDINALKDKITKKVSEVSIQMKPGLDDAKEKASKTFATASESIKLDMETGGIQALVKNKFFIASIAVCFVLLLMFFGMFSGGGKPMPLTMENLNRLGEIWDAKPYQMTENQIKQFKNDPKAAFEFLLFEPIEELGYDFEATIIEISDKYLNGDLTTEQSMQAMVVILIPAQIRDKLYDNDVISKGVKDRLDKVAEKAGL